MNKLVEITAPKEIKKFVKSSNYLLVNDGLDEYVIHESDLSDYNSEKKNLKSHIIVN